jgi:hypothetical protein
MDERDLDRIEQALALRLPDEYRRSVAPFPITEAVGNSDSQVWDDADSLIALNRRLRAGVDGWPAWLFAIGQAKGDPCGYAIDTRTLDVPIWWLERMELGRASGTNNQRSPSPPERVRPSSNRLVKTTKEHRSPR